MAKAVHKNPRTPSPDPEFLFHGNGTVLKPCHITRYIYPSLCNLPPGCLRLQPPSNPSSRSRPQGSGSWGTDGHTFLSITNTRQQQQQQKYPARDAVSFAAWSAREVQRDRESGNALARAMARVSLFVGNTVLEAGKFQLRKGEGMCFVVVRRSVVVLGGGGGAGRDGDGDKKGVGKEEERYVIPCGEWRGMMPPMVRGKEYDCWWVRLHNLFQASYDRAFFHARDQIDNVLQIAPPLITWRPRPDIEALATIYRDTPPPPAQAKYLGDACPACSRTWFTESEYACRLSCGHFLCLECLTQHVDSSAGRGKLLLGETDPLTKFFRCMECKHITALRVDRTAVMRADELPWWRWKISMHRLEKEATVFWLVRLQTLPHSGWFRDIPQDWDTDRQIKEIRVRVRYDDAVAFMQVPKRIWAMLPYGFSLDNPVESCEARVLEKCLRSELKRLSLERRVFNTKEMLEHMAKVGRNALRLVVVEDVGARLGNPVTPPGYEAYRDFLCEWTARGVFMCPMGRMPIMEFLKTMDRNKDKAWWKDERDVFFDP